MANRNQLRVLTDGQATAIRAAGNGLAVAEIVKIYWPEPDGTKAYAWWNLLDDDLYSDSGLSDFLDGAPLLTAFVAEDENKTERFHEIPRTSQIGDDTIRMRFANRGKAFETLALTHRGGVKAEVFYFFPQIDGGLAINWFSGHLRAPDAVNTDFVEITVAAGLRSPDLLVPNSIHSGQCRFAARFGGRFDPLLANNPCDYDIHTGGSRGLLDGGEPFTSCPGAKGDCMDRLGDLLSYGGFDAVADTSAIGGGVHTTVSETQGQTTHLKQPIQTAYGEGTALNLPLLDYAKEYNPSPKNQDKGTIRALFEVSNGPIEEITEVEMMDRPLPRSAAGGGHGTFGHLLAELLAQLGGAGLDGQGLETRLGTQQQAPTTYSVDVLNYNRLAHFRGDVNPINPIGVAPSTITAKCRYKGRNTIKVYSDEETFAYAYSVLRAWVALDLLTDTTYGHREDIARHSLEDFLHLAELGSTFNGLAQGKSAHQQFQDICLAGGWFLPFNHNGLTRWLAIEEYDLEAADIPKFTDQGSARNILVDEHGVSRLTVNQKDDDKIPNVVTLTFNDAAHKDLERPILFPDSEQQELAGQVYGDGSLREVPDQETAFGVNNIEEAKRIGWYILDHGRFYAGGTKNNCEVVFTCPGFLPEVLDLHENKVFKLTSAKLLNAKDRDGNIFTHFIVREIDRTQRGEAIIKGQAFGALRTDLSGAEEGDTHTGGDGEFGEVADARLILFDRIWRDEELAAGVPGFYAAMAPSESGKIWGSGEVWRDKGAGYVELLDNRVAAILGDATTVLAGTTLGSETVRVQLQPGQELPSFSGAEVDAGAGYVYLGGELFHYETATQIDDDPNIWELSTLSLRGDRCTEDFIATHATGDDFVYLNGAVVFHSIAKADIGQAYDFKGVTSGADIDDVTAQSFTHDCPNFQVVTPADYALEYDPIRMEIIHTWTAIADACLIAPGLYYEIWNDSSGSPGARIWSGNADTRNTAVNVSGTYTFYLRAVTNFSTGEFVSAMITVDFDEGTFMVEDGTGELLIEDGSGEFFIEDE